MTQQYYGPPPGQQAPVQPQQGYQQYQPAPQGYAPPPGQPAQPTYQQGFPPYQQSSYGAPQGQPPVPAGPPLPQGSLDDFFNQRSVGSGKGLSWSQKPDGYRYVGVVTKTPTNADVFVDTQPAAQGGMPKQNRDGSYKYVLQVQLRIAWLDQFQQFTYPEQDARLFLRGGLRDEVTRAMHESGDEGVPKEGALVDITLTGRKPGNNIATNVFAVVYRPAGTWENDPQYAAFAPALLGGQSANNPAPQQQMQNQFQQAPAQYGGAPQQASYQQGQFVQYGGQTQQADPNTQQYAQPVSQAPVPGPAPQYGGQAYDPNQASNWIANPTHDPNQPSAPVNQGPAPSQPAAYDPNTQQQNGQMQLPYGGAPQGGPPPASPGAGQMPAGAPVAQPGTTGSALDPARQQLLARLTAGQPPQG